MSSPFIYEEPVGASDLVDRQHELQTLCDRGFDARNSRLTDTSVVSHKAEQSACQETVSDLAPLTQGAARSRSRRPGSEETRSLDGRAGARRGSRATASGGDTTPSVNSPPGALVH